MISILRIVIVSWFFFAINLHLATQHHGHGGGGNNNSHAGHEIDSVKQKKLFTFIVRNIHRPFLIRKANVMYVARNLKRSKPSLMNNLILIAQK